MSLPRSLRVLLAHSIDYAGMFPPCSLGLQQALEKHSAYVRSPDAWILSTFVLSTDQFTAAKKQLSSFDPNPPLGFSARGPQTADASAFRKVLPQIASEVRALSAYNVDLVS